MRTLAGCGWATISARRAAVIILGIVSVAALLLLASGTPAAAVKDLLAIVFPPLVAIAAHSARGSRR
jgi:hypothetical protein